MVRMAPYRDHGISPPRHSQDAAMHADLVAESQFFNPAFMPDFVGLLAEAGAAAAGQPESAVPQADTRHGCGWFDSTYDLQQGLTVTEGIEIAVFRRCEAEAAAACALLAVQVSPAVF